MIEELGTMPDIVDDVWNWAENIAQKPANAKPAPPPRLPEEGSYVLTWGKHKGRSINDVPSDYLVWCLDNMDWLQPGGPKFNKTLWEIIRRRLSLPTDVPQPTSFEPQMPPGKPSEVLRRTIKAWYCQMSRRFHPDAGGSAQEMIVVNLCHDTLLELIDNLGETKK